VGAAAADARRVLARRDPSRPRPRRCLGGEAPIAPP
jgi:hypothetical protein